MSAAIVVAAATPCAADWSQFRGADGSGVAADGSPPTEWSGTKNIAWKASLPGPGASSPIVWEDRVYVTCHTGYGLSPENPGDMEALKRHLLCFQLSDGALLWQREVDAVLPESIYGNRMEWHGYASQTPVADADGVYCFFGKSGVQAWTHSGEPRWQTLVGDGNHGWGSAASPILSGELVIINAFIESGALIALDRKSGKERWRHEGLKETWSTPLLVQPKEGGPEVVLGVFGKLIGIDAATGEQHWSAAAADWYVVGSAVAKEDVVFSLAGKGFEAATAVRTGGRGEVTGTHRLWQTRKGSNVSSPVLVDGRLYFSHEQGSFFYCLDAATGDTVFQERLPRRLGFVYSSPVVADGKIYLFSRQGGSVVINAGDTYELIAQNPALDPSPFNGSPAVAGDRLLVRSDKYLYCISPGN